MTSKKSYAYCFTINNYTDADIEELKKLEDNPKTRYIIVGRETGEEGTPHIQGYVYFQNQMVFSTFKKLLTRAHIEASRGSIDDNITYCSKDGDFYEHGERPVNQKRKGELGAEYWNSQKKLAIEGKLDEIDPQLFVTHYRTLKAIQKDYANMPTDLPGVTDNDWYYGPSRTGKSFTARQENPGAYLKMCNKWWDGYQSEDTVLIEDFDKRHGEHLAYYMKIWSDYYAFPAEIKGGKINIRPKKIVVTSNWHPSEIWTDNQTLEPIINRFNVKHFQGSINDVL